MSVVLASTYIAVHLFGFTTSTNTVTYFDTLTQCNNNLDIKEATFKQDKNITLIRENDYLKIVNESKFKIEAHMCYNAA